ncbi:SufD family Fe-S cluster assembly protein [Liquorilactobacillus satsumensis]|uniref:SufD family Fe-S cluster assembly protein n=1 Tax=Liquorilactobacillus satsumensis TaxID=259059 RepID=UPI0039E96547
MKNGLQNYHQLESELKLAAEEHGEPHWLVERRLSALKKLIQNREISLLSANLATKLPKKADFSQQQELIKQYTEKNLTTKKCLKFVQIGQTVVAINLPDELEEKGVIFTDIFTAFREHPRFTQNNFMGKIISTTENWLTNYQLAWFNSGVFIYLPHEMHIKHPFEIYTIQSAGQRPLVNQILVIAEPGSSCSIIHHVVSKDNNPQQLSSIVEINAKANSKIDFATVATSDGSYYIKRRAILNRNAAINWTTGMFSKRNSLIDTSCRLIGSDTIVNQILAMLATGQQQSTIINQVDGLVDKAKTHEFMRGVQIGSASKVRLPSNENTKLKKVAAGDLSEKSYTDIAECYLPVLQQIADEDVRKTLKQALNEQLNEFKNKEVLKL